MAKGLGNLTLAEARRIAERSFADLDGRHGDPSKNANWIRERQLAEIVIGLLDRIEAVSAALKEPRV